MEILNSSVNDGRILTAVLLSIWNIQWLHKCKNLLFSTAVINCKLLLFPFQRLLHMTAHATTYTYRPISLLKFQSLANLLKGTFTFCSHYIWMKMIQFLNSYQQGKSALTSLFTVVHDWLRILESGQEVCSIFFWSEESIWFSPTLTTNGKTWKTGLSPHLQEWISSYLTDRQQHLVVGGEASHDNPVLLGVPQARDRCWVLCFFFYISMTSLKYSYLVGVSYKSVCWW